MGRAQDRLRAQELAGETGPTPCGTSEKARQYFAFHSKRLEALLDRHLLEPEGEDEQEPKVVPATRRNIRKLSAPLLAMCANCPQRAVIECGQLGVISDHTGVAGGLVLQRGRPRLPEHRRRMAEAAADDESAA